MATLDTAALTDPITLKIGGRYWDPSRNYADDAAHTDYITITTTEPLDPSQHATLASLNATIQEQVAPNTYLCHYPPPDLTPIRSLLFVRQADVFRSKFKIVQDLKDTNNAAANGEALPVAGLAKTETTMSTEVCTVDIVLHQDQHAENIVSKLCEEAGVNEDLVEYTSKKIRMTVERALLKQIATHDYIRSIEEVVPKGVHNNLARDIMQADIVINGTAYHGEGQIIAVADTGFDIGDAENCHPAFKGKILDLKSVARVSKSDTKNRRLPEITNDLEGHGTHVCGSIVGENMPSKPYKEEAVGGVAQKAKLIVQSMYYHDEQTDIRGIRTPLDLTEGLFDEPYYKSNCRIFTNSWGDELEPLVGQRAYTKAGAQEVDEFVFRTRDAVILFSAGNDNDGKFSGKPNIGSQAAAKNCITVGATGSKRVMGKKDVMKHESMFERSSWGPTKEGRIKPDVVAPGVNILSTATQHRSRQSVYEKKSTYDQYFRTNSGTSMSTPLVAGCVAVLREVLQKQGVSNPSAALVKALIINGAERLDGIPQNAQGFGRVNLQNSVTMVLGAGKQEQHGVRASNGFFEGIPLRQGDVSKIQIGTSGEETSSKRLKVTMVYTDPPSDVLQNNLVLSVALPGGRQMRGNWHTGEDFDNLNNVEQVVAPEVEPGVVEVSVWAQSITMADETQDFALAWSCM
ncbi:subtilisin-like protein [Sporormia fimetaria CBS 119925]|uniref:Subtilisin-like protein n=1 Tax=Sporormia fimetaria CBS 119925 TaxID=1340428 RepID=A0A6A6VIQ2_9PLEO|nr:subtilisin-like protein [Sporormia fimetaria CBS 119925]